ncbi:MAG: double zinc ribbon domain-containing protein [Elusimicrobiota bacterium]
MNISKIINPVLNFFFPNTCIICGEDVEPPDLSVCNRCLNKIEYIKPPYCLTCHQPLPDGGAHCWQCRKTKYHFEKIITVGKYTGILRELILKFKEAEFLKITLGKLLLDTTLKKVNTADIDLITAVPLSKKREFKRGYNQSQLLAEFLGKNLNKQVISNNLVRVKETRPQFELTREERLVNLKDAFSVKEPSVFRGKNVAIVDDITTTCTTIEECSKVLRHAGAKKIYGLILARD